MPRPFSPERPGYNEDMETMVLGWDLERGPRWVPPYEQALAESWSQGSVTTRFRIEGPIVPAVGATVHLMLQGRTRGLVGRGTVRTAPFPAVDPAAPGELTHYLLVEWDHLLPVEDRISTEELSARVPDVDWTRTYGPALSLSADQSARLARVWHAPHPSARPGPSRYRGPGAASRPRTPRQHA